MTTAVRPAARDDLPALDRIVRDAFEASYARFMPAPYVESRRQWTEMPDTARRLLADTGVAVIDGVPAGYVCCEGGSVAELWVGPAFQRRGIGRALMRWAEDRLRGRGCSGVSLHCYEPNETAMRFYLALGFAVADRFPSRNVPGGPVTVCLLEKRLGDKKREEPA